MTDPQKVEEDYSHNNHDATQVVGMYHKEEDKSVKTSNDEMVSEQWVNCDTIEEEQLINDVDASTVVYDFLPSLADFCSMQSSSASPKSPSCCSSSGSSSSWIVKREKEENEAKGSVSFGANSASTTSGNTPSCTSTMVVEEMDVLDGFAPLVHTHQFFPEPVMSLPHEPNDSIEYKTSLVQKSECLSKSATKEARKNRMARQRRFLSHHKHHNATEKEWKMQNGTDGNENSDLLVCLDSSTDPTTEGVLTHRQMAIGKRQLQGWKMEKNMRLLLQKMLKQSDVGNVGRIVLPKKDAEMHLPELETGDGITIAMEDVGTSRVWNMRYRFWPNNKSRMYLLENTGEFVRSNGLQEGDFIFIYSDVKSCKFLIKGVKVVPRQAGAKRAHAKVQKR